MLTLLTPTGCRPEAFAMCQRWMGAQDYAGPVQWVVVDDGETPQPITIDRWPVVVVRPKPYWDGGNTLARNILAGLEHCGDRIAIVEDDDYYAPGWLSAVWQAFQHAELVGQSLTRYYHVGRNTSQDFGRQRHASLCATALRDGAIDTLRSVCVDGPRGIDLRLWRKHSDSYLMDCDHVTGIKGLPGRNHIGMGKNLTGYATKTLRDWIGNDADAYL